MATSTTGSLWETIQADIVGLMREADSLRTDLARNTEKAQKDQKQLLLDMLDVLDGFERVFANIEPREQTAERQAKAWAGNFRSVRKVLEGHLRKHNVVRIESPDGKAIPGFHTIIEAEEQLDMEDGTILEEMQKGYLWQGKVLRAAHVKAVKN